MKSIKFSQCQQLCITTVITVQITTVITVQITTVITVQIFNRLCYLL